MHPAPPLPDPNATPNALRLAALYTVVFVEIGIAMPFMPVWLNALGLDAGLIGGLLALPIAIRVVATAPLMGLIDRGFSARTLLLVGSLVLAATYAAMPVGAALGWGALAGLVAINAVAAAPMVASIDYLTLAAVRRSEALAAEAGSGPVGERPEKSPGTLDYPRIRMAGSIGFLAANLAGGALLGWLGEAFAVPLLLTGLALAASAVAFASRDTVGQAGRGGRASHGTGHGTGRPGLPRVLWLALGAGALIQSSHAAVYAFGSISWSAAGVPGAWIGALWAIGVAAEILLFAVIGRLPASWRSPFRLLALGAVAAAIRAVGMAFAGDRLPALIGLQLLHGLTFGATHFGAMRAVSAFAPEGARGRAQGTVSSATALASSVATLGCGAVYRSEGAPATFLAMAPLAVLGACLVGLAARSARSSAAP